MIHAGMKEGMYDVHCPNCNKYLFTHHSNYQGVVSSYCEKCKTLINFTAFVEIKRKDVDKPRKVKCGYFIDSVLWQKEK
jgi:phage FluMu protein Com